MSFADSTAFGLIAALAIRRSATLASAWPGTARVRRTDSRTSGLPGSETTLLVLGRESEVTDGVRGMLSSPEAAMP